MTIVKILLTCLTKKTASYHYELEDMLVANL